VHYLMLQYRQCPVKLIVAKPASGGRIGNAAMGGAFTNQRIHAGPGGPMQHEVKLTDRQRAEAVADLFELAVSSKRTSIPTKCCA
jgi:hypothetical protein